MSNSQSVRRENEDELYNALTAPLDDPSEVDESWGETWTYESSTAGYNSGHTFYWDFVLNDGSYFSAPQWSVLYASVQACINSIFRKRDNGRGRRAGSVGQITAQMRQFVRWMTMFGYRDLSCLDEFAYEEYAQWIGLTKCRGQGDASITIQSAFCVLAFPAMLYYQNAALIDAGLPPVAGVPYGGESTYAMARQICDKEVGFYPAVPDEVYIPAMNKVVEWLDRQIPEIQATVDAYITPYGGCEATNNNRRRRVLNELVFSPDEDTGEPWFAGFAEPIYVTRHFAHNASRRGQEAKLNIGHTTRDVLQASRNCCTIGIQGTVGMRVSEVCGLKVTAHDQETGLPDCVKVERSKSGLEELFFIVGTVFKDKTPPRPGRWLAGSRPLGSDYLPIPIKAVVALDRLFAPWREMAGSDSLIVGFRNRVGVALRGEDITPISAGAVREGQKEWVRTYVKVPPEFANWEITTHQWRKSFARFCIRVDSTLLPAISRHLQHISIAMTQRHYTGEDRELLWLIRDAAIELAAELLYAATHEGAKAAGGLMEEIPDIASEMSRHVDPHDGKGCQAFLRSTLERDNTWAWGLPWGACLFRPEFARCNLKGPSYKIFATAPALDGLSAYSSCGQCKNQLVLPQHLPFWLARRDELLVTKKQNNRKGLKDIDFIVGHRLVRCEGVIQKIHGASIA
ncbi:hypothetical protein [Paraburkholderia bryophila]|uniref:Integrase n=1 Tax=Paraburkholderia bryophila TaxID=420952 RepID=A0A7Y9WNM4_9BURK|nr:hypothetical protein [Paraburkholderia bryophila]NYH24239.1 integrase [Paraburkholderia bryophila]